MLRFRHRKNSNAEEESLLSPSSTTTTCSVPSSTPQHQQQQQSHQSQHSQQQPKQRRQQPQEQAESGSHHSASSSSLDYLLGRAASAAAAAASVATGTDCGAGDGSFDRDDGNLREVGEEDVAYEYYQQDEDFDEGDKKRRGRNLYVRIVNCIKMCGYSLESWSLCCSIFSATGILFLCFVGLLLMTQPFYIGGVEDVDNAKNSAFGAAGAFFFFFLLSTCFLILGNGREEDSAGEGSGGAPPPPIPPYERDGDDFGGNGVGGGVGTRTLTPVGDSGTLISGIISPAGGGEYSQVPFQDHETEQFIAGGGTRKPTTAPGIYS